MRSVIIRCDGSSTIGMGHIVRCLALAVALRKNEIFSTFAMNEDAGALAMVAAAGFPSVVLPPGYGAETLLGVASAQGASLFFLDQRDGFPAAGVAALRQARFPVIVYDDLSERRLAADLCIYPPIEQLRSISWKEFDGEIVSGWEWILLRPEFSGITRRAGYRDSPHVLITMGGADPSGFTENALAVVESAGFDRVTAIIGPMMADAERIRRRFSRLPGQIHLISPPPVISEVMLQHDLALASFGVTAYELVACGVPMALWALSEDHLVSAATLAAAGIATVAPHPGKLNDDEVAAMIAPWIVDAGARARAGFVAQRLCDGLGAERVVQKALELMGQR